MQITQVPIILQIYFLVSGITLKVINQMFIVIPIVAHLQAHGKINNADSWRYFLHTSLSNIWNDTILILELDYKSGCLKYLCLVGGNIIYNAVSSYVVPDSIQRIKITDKFQSCSSLLRTTGARTTPHHIKLRRTWKEV